MSVEEFKRYINSDVKSFLDYKEVETLENAAPLEYNYILTPTVSFLTRQILETYFTHLLVLNPVLVSNLLIPIRMLPNPNLLLKTTVQIPYLSLFVIIANNQVILFLTVLF